METLTEIKYKLPAYWASYLVNGDASGLLDECPVNPDQSEQETINQWLESEGNPDFFDCGEPYFSWRNEATNLGGDVCDYVAHVSK